LNGTHQQLLNYPDNVNLLCGNVYTIKKTEPLIVANNKVALEVNAEKMNYKFVSP
jgi:hypothetical protein